MLTFIETCWEEKNPWKYEFCEHNTEALTNIGLRCPHNIDWRICMPCFLFFFLFNFLRFSNLYHVELVHEIPLAVMETPSLLVNLKSFLSSGRHSFCFISNLGLLWSSCCPLLLCCAWTSLLMKPDRTSDTSNWFQISSRATFYTLLQELSLSMSQEAFPFALSPLVPFWWPLLYYVCKGP